MFAARVTKSPALNINWNSTACLLLLSIFVSMSAIAAEAQHKQLYVVPTKGKVLIDAKLDDWDLSGQIFSFVVPETQDMQSAKTAMMYDSEAFYICGIVRDTSPLMNRHDPRTDASKAWDADVCQVFFSLDPDESQPLPYSQWNKEHWGKAPVATMMLWHYTDRKEACLSMFQGMKFNKPLQPELGKEGVIDHKYYQGAYRKTDDGGGYIFEYRIPWKTMKLKRVPKAKDKLAMSFTVFWSRPDGLKTAGRGAWVYDLMSSPGFVFQNTNCWGKIIFHPENNVPKELVNEGVPATRPLPLKFSYDLPAGRETHEVTIQLYDEHNQVVRMLVAQQDRRAGPNVELWDGCDDQGKPLPSGKYTWKGIIHDPITTQWRLSAHNSGTPPYPTPNNKGGWGGDHGSPMTVSPLANGMILSWNSCEYGWGVIRVDLNGKKVWGSKHCATYLANDGKHLFVAGGHGFQKGTNIQILDLKDSRAISLGNGVSEYKLPDGTEEQNRVTGLACKGDVLYASYKAQNLVVAFHIKNGKIKTTWNLPEPERLCVRPDGTLLAISQGKIRLVKGAEVTPFIESHLDHPVSIYLADDGTIYVANQGKLQNISVFDANGKYLRSIGKEGGRPAVGKYDPAGLYMPGGIAIDAKGRLWVAETKDSPKRISVWDTANGKNLKEFFGSSGYFGYGFIDPAKPNEMYAHNVLWQIDWKTRKVTPLSTIWRQTQPNMMGPIGVSGYHDVLRVMTAANGRQYAWGRRYPGNSILMRREGDLYLPFSAILPVNRNKTGVSRTGIQLIDSNAKDYPKGRYFWQDANNDQIVQKDELSRIEGRSPRTEFVWIDKDLTLWLRPGTTLAPTTVKQNGQPVYDLSAQKTVSWLGKDTQISHGYFQRDSKGNTYTYAPRNGPSFIKWNADGDKEWFYSNIIRWHDALNLPITGPGRLHGMTGLMGIGGRYLGSMTYFGSNHVFRDDGMYVAALLKDGRVSKGGNKKNTDQGQPEGQNGQFVKLNIDGKDRYFIIHGGQDSRVWEVMGLDTVEDLPGGTYIHTPESFAKTGTALKEYNAKLNKNREVKIVHGKNALRTATPVGRTIDSKHSFEARVAYDDKSLFIQFDVTSASELQNGQPESKIIFRGGNCLDIQLAADTQADPKRKTPAPGDIRLLITRKGKKPFAVLYRPKVKDFKGKPFVFTSPTGQEPFDEIREFKDFSLNYRKTATGYHALVTIPQSALGLSLKKGDEIPMDLGIVFGNDKGTKTTGRAYVHNTSFAAGVVNDIPHESRLEPAQWKPAIVE